MSVDRRVRQGLLVAFVVGLGVSITLSEIALAALIARRLALAAGRRLTGVEVTKRGWPLALPFATWIAVSLLAAVLSARPGESVAHATRGLWLIATFYVLLDALADGDAAERFITGLFAVLALVSALSVLQVVLCPALGAASRLGRIATKCQRAHGFYSIYMTLAGVLNILLLAVLPKVLPPMSSPYRWRIVAWLTCAVAFALTYVRGAWVGFIAGVGVLAAFLHQRRTAIVVGALVVLVMVLMVPGVRRRAASIGDPADPTARERRLMWASGLTMARDYPLHGVGPGQVKHLYPRYAAPDALRRTRGHLHNTPLQILVERGLLGLLAWLSIFVVFFARVRTIARGLASESREARARVVGCAAAILGFLVAGLFEYNFGDSEVVLVAYAIMALPFVIGRRRAVPV